MESEEMSARSAWLPRRDARVESFVAVPSAGCARMPERLRRRLDVCARWSRGDQAGPRRGDRDNGARPTGPALVGDMSGSKAAYWARCFGDSGEVIQHSFWLFDTEDDARAAETIFNSLRDMPEAPAILIGVDVCEVTAQM